jgi:hypothetical protein
MMRIPILLVLAACAEPGLEPATHPTRELLDDSASGFEDTGEPEALSPDNARILLIDFPAQLDCGEMDLGTVVVENIGTTVWTREDGLKLGAVGDEDEIYDSADVRVWLDEGVVIAPGERHTFEIDLLGTDSDWQMVREGVHWFGEIASTDVDVICEEDEDPGEETEESEALPLPDMWYVVEDLADEHPEMLANSCQDTGGNWDFLDTLVERLREVDERWGYNWKRGVEGDPSRDVVDYHYGYGEREGSTDVYILDVIVGHCGGSPEPGWLDQTQPTADAGTIGMWTSRGQF